MKISWYLAFAIFLVYNMTLNDTRANVLPIKIVSLHREEHGCSSELLRHNASVARIEIENTTL